MVTREEQNVKGRGIRSLNPAACQAKAELSGAVVSEDLKKCEPGGQGLPWPVGLPLAVASHECVVCENRKVVSHIPLNAMQL